MKHHKPTSEQEDTPDSKPPGIPEKEGLSPKRFTIFSDVVDGSLTGEPLPIFL